MFPISKLTIDVASNATILFLKEASANVIRYRLLQGVVDLLYRTITSYTPLISSTKV